MWPRCRNDEVCLFELALLFDQYRRRWSRFAVLECLRSHGAAAFTTVERFTDEFDQTLVIDISRGCDNEIVVVELARVKTDGSFVIERRNSFPRAFDRATERLIREIGRVEKLSEQLVRRVLDHFHLFEDDFLLAFQVFLFKTRVRNEVGK